MNKLKENMTNLKVKIEEELHKAGISHQFIALPPELPLDLEAHVKFHGIELKDALPTLVFQTEKGLVVVQKSGNRKIDNRKLKEVLGVKRLSFASPEQLAELGTEVGLVPLTGLDLPFYIDKSALEVEEVYGGGGDRLFALKFRTTDLVRLNKAKVADFTTPMEITPMNNTQNTKNNRILSGITPSGSALHIGNYFGAVKPQIELQDTAQTYYFVADLHALTTVQDKAVLEKNIAGVVMDFLALGLDPEKCVFFRQSDVPAHSQLTIVLSNYISYGQMQRMHAFKDKLQKNADVESINMGLFNYPILMAADILLYKPYGVPVGEDQRQHIELTRDIAENFNRSYGREILPLPEPLISKEVGKIIGTDGQRKMSKSLGNIIGIFEDPAIIKKQIMSSFTDPNRKKATDPGTVEGNPVFQYHDLLNDDLAEVEDLKNRYRKGEVGDVEVKEKLFEAHQRKFAQARERRQELEKNPALVKEILASGAAKARQFADQTMAEVYSLIGIHNALNK
jgi:tryptophanyl-tRNA synthetase